ncbi:MAG: cation transporter, partial [candidate division NC10 bacterium]|nr:cation transporter [candidate division NC10 bacterium]
MTARSMRRPDGPTELPGPDGDPAGAIRRLRWAILLNSLFVALELAAGFTVNSLALISDAWHNLTDVLG